MVKALGAIALLKRIPVKNRLKNIKLKTYSTFKTPPYYGGKSGRIKGEKSFYKLSFNKTIKNWQTMITKNALEILEKYKSKSKVLYMWYLWEKFKHKMLGKK